MLFIQTGLFATSAGATAGWQEDPARMRTTSLLERQGTSAVAYTRIFCLLGLVHELLLNNQQASQRDVYYRHKQGFVLSCLP